MNPACPSENCPLNPLMSWRLTASTMLKPISIAMRALYVPSHRSTEGATRATSRMTSGTGRLALSVSHQPCAAGSAEPGRYGRTPPPADGGGAAGEGASVSDLLDDMLAEQPRRFDEQDGDQQHERDRVAVLRTVLDVPDDHHLDQPDDHRARHRAGDVPDPPEDGGDERLD